MKYIRVILILIVALCGAIFLYCHVATAEDKITTVTADGTFTFAVEHEPGPEIEFTQDGRVFLNGKLIQELDHPEIKEAIISIAESLRENSMIAYYDRQTTYLLTEIERLQKELKKCRDLWEPGISQSKIVQ